MHDDAADLQWIARATGARRVERGERIQLLWSGYGEIYRVHLHGAASRTAIVKSVTPPSRARTGDRSHDRKCASYDVEIAWYRSLSKRCDDACRVPLLFDGARFGDRFLLVLEDLDAKGFGGRRGRNPRSSDVDLCLDWLAAFHARFLDTKPEGLWATGTYWHLATRPDELAAIEDEALRRAAPILDARLRVGRFHTLVHGDAKLANYCFGAQAVAAVDFQYVGGGCGMSDLAYFLGSLADDGLDEGEQRHLDRYFASLRSALADRPIDVDALELEWRTLYPIASADFHRFVAGWAPQYWANDREGQRVVQCVLRGLR